jgi:glycosidase
MVLRLSCLLLLLTACLHAPAVVRLPEPARATVVVVLETADRVSTLALAGHPAGVAMSSELARRNLDALLVPLCDAPPSSGPPCLEPISAQGPTAARLAAIAAQPAAASDYVVLVEAKVSFYAQLEGRYRWTVKVRLSVARADHLEGAQADEFDVPVVLEFAHEDAHAAFEAALPLISRHLGQLLDRSLPGLAARPAASGALRGALRDTDAIYFVLVDRFKNGDPGNDGGADPADPEGFMGGDLAGVDQSVDYIADLGFDQVWTSPIARMRTSKFVGHGAYHGYWTWDPAVIEPRFGDDTVVARLRADLAARGLGLILDVVMNHVAWDSPVRVRHPAWFHHLGAITDWDDRQQVENGDVFGLPDLALEKDVVYRYMRDAALGWQARVRPAGFRLDAVRHVPLAVWARFTRDVHATAPAGFFLLGELLDGSPAHLATAFREGGFDALFDFPLAFAMRDVFCGQAPAGRLGVILTADRRYPAGRRLVTLLDNHDLPRIASACGGDLGKVERALTFMLTARGVPSIMYGTEMGMLGDHEPANRAAMPWDAPAPLAPLIKKLLAERRSDDALGSGQDLIIAASHDLFAYARLGSRHAVLVALNTGPSPASVVLAGEPHAVPSGQLVVQTVATRALPQLRQLAAMRDEKRGTIRLADDVPRCAQGRWLAVGSSAALGDWEPRSALELARVTPLALPDNGVVELKLAFRQPDGHAVWSQGDNTLVFVPAGGAPPGDITLHWTGPSPCLP